MAASAEIEFETKLGALGSLTGVPTHYCPGCEHGVLTKLIASALDNLGLRSKAVMVDSVGCSVLAYKYINCDHIQSPHGRAPAIAAGIKRTHPELTVFTVQGDGDGMAIGLSETLYAAIRGEKITQLFVNNAIYGMTGGQMAPTTLQGQVTVTTPLGRDTQFTGSPIDISRLLATIQNSAYVRRAVLAITPVETPRGITFLAKNVLEAKKIVENAFKVQMMGGYAAVEFLSSCSVNWKTPILESKKFVNNDMVRQFPPGVYKDTFGVEGAK